MKRRVIRIRFPLIDGNIQALVSCDHEDPTLYLQGDREGLLSLAEMLKCLAEVDQGALPSLPDDGASEHVHLEPDLDLSANSRPLVVGRLDFKHGQFDTTYRPRTKKRKRPIVNRW